ncbi:MAG: hemolysin family protein [Cyclobacteriaceae bacterium]|nr:HlyC/CorC family transporter [Cyclobacteriaceae bacterium]MCH8515495.1 hemolysin family protein [Cyclobacteriaceae bacterium]
MESSYLIYIFFTLLFSAFFSGIEIAFVSANKLQIELQKNQGRFSSKLLSHLFQNPSRFITSTLLGNTISLVVYGVLMARFFEPLIQQTLPESINTDASVLILQTVFSTIIVLVTAEFLPKSLFLINANAALDFFTIPIVIIYYLLLPFSIVLNWLSKLLITYGFKFSFREDKPVFNLTDLNHFIQNTIEQADEKKEVGEVNTKIFKNALDFKSVKVRDCMIPRTEIVSVDISESVDVLSDAFTKSGHSKIVIINNTIDDVIGFCHTISMFSKPKTIREVLNTMSFVPEVTPVNDLMIRFIKERKSIAVVVDEFGGTSGIVTLEDIIEEIFGEIEDEHDSDTLREEKISENEYLLSARLEIDNLNEKYGWDLPEGDFDTLGGLIIDFLEDIPVPKQLIDIGDFEFEIVSMTQNKIELVKLRRKLSK